MLARKFRLRKKEVERVYKKGRTASQTLFLFRALVNRAGHARFSVVISKKTLPLAVDRNKARRKIYQIIWQKKNLWEQKSFDLVITLKKYEQISHLEEEITQILNRL